MTSTLEHPLIQQELTTNPLEDTAAPRAVRAGGVLDITHQGNGALRARDGLPSPATWRSRPL